MKPETQKRLSHIEAQKRYVSKKTADGAKRMCVWVPAGREVEFKLALKKLQRSWTSSTD
mgnify:CR=1 FL=1|tara:strand:- start:989 stop:1165 length:177 start_codon:yes stop_codon:yes gene_type:complete